MIAGIMLAAGRSSRFGTDKRLHNIAGRPLIYYALSACLGARLASTYVVVGAGDVQIRETLRPWLPIPPVVHFVENERPQLGMMSSLKTGLAALPAAFAAAMVLHADMPLVPSRVMDQLIEAFELNGGVILPKCQGRWRHPRVIPRSLFREFLSLGDNEKGTKVFERHLDRITTVEVDDSSLFFEVDSTADVGPIDDILSRQHNR